MVNGTSVRTTRLLVLMRGWDICSQSRLYTWVVHAKSMEQVQRIQMLLQHTVTKIKADLYTHNRASEGEKESVREPQVINAHEQILGCAQRSTASGTNRGGAAYV